MPSDPLLTPYRTALFAAVEDAYAAFGEGRVSKWLETCACPVCMTEHTRQQIIATPTRQLSEELICQYSNSAHGVAKSLEDLRLLLPRYLELIAQDDAVDYVGVGAELTRFGDAVRAGNAPFNKMQRSALTAWADVALWHFAYAEAMEMENIYGAPYLLETLLAGEWDAQPMFDTMNCIFSDPEIGARALVDFAKAAGREIKHKRECAGIDWFALRYASDEGRIALARWLNSHALRDHLSEAATDPAISAEDQTAAAILLASVGQFAPEAFPRDRDA